MDIEMAFNGAKASLVLAAALGHQSPTAELVVNASTSHVGAINNMLAQPGCLGTIGFFFMKLNFT
jgi:hypothetical protein